MSAPANDNFASATVITGASGALGSQTNISATSESGEPAHYNYNPGPATPVGRGLTGGPYASVWYSWTPSTSGNYFFSTRGTSGFFNLPSFPSTIQAFTGSTVSTLTPVTLLMDQSVGDGNGDDPGASIAIAAVASTTYYIQVDTRVSVSTGNFRLRWGAYNPIRLGACTGAAVNQDPSQQCVGAVQVTGGSSDAFYSFGSQPVMAGNYCVAYIDGTPIPQYANSVYPAPQTFPNLTIIDGDLTGFSEWDHTVAYSTGAIVMQLENYADYAAAKATGPTTAGLAPYTGGGSCNSPWVCYEDTDTIPLTICSWSSPVPHAATGVVGLAYLAGGTSGVSTPYPNYMLLYFPMDATVLNSTTGFVLTGSGTSWTIQFNILNDSSQTWDGTTVTLLNTGGVSGASAPLTGVSLTHNTYTTTGFFTFTASPGMVTATIQLSRNGQVACTLAYPLYPVAALAFIAVGGGSGLNVFERTGCSPHTWVQSLSCFVSWPPNASALPSSWGNSFTCIFSVASGPATLADDNAPGDGQAANNCVSLASITNSLVYCGGGDADYAIFKPSIWVTGVVQYVPIQCTLNWNCGSGIAYPTFTQTLTIPAT